MNNIVLQIDAQGTARVRFDRDGSSANIFDRDTLEELDSVIAEIEQNSSVERVVFLSDKPSIFLAGADLQALSGASAAQVEVFLELGQTVFNRIANLAIPTAAAIHGACLGGGLELALACDVRVASLDRKTKIGLPETQLGIVPAWGGSTRLPRLIGIGKALSLILSGKQMSGKHARSMGVVDAVCARERLELRCVQLLQEMPTRKRLWWDNNIVAAAIARAMSKKRVRARSGDHYPALEEAIAIVTASPSRSLQASLSAEREATLRLAGTDTTRQLLRLFQLSEKAKKIRIPDADGGVVPRRTAVLGAGIMGAGIAHWIASREMPVLLKDIDSDALLGGMKTIAKRFDEAVGRRIFTRAEAAARSARITPFCGDGSLEEIDIVIEAAVENMDIKKKIFADLAGRSRSDTILATNTSALSVSELASSVEYPERVVGIHFFNPVHRMKLVEVICTPDTAAEVTQASVDFVLKLGKSPVVVKDSPGFLVNRILLPYLIEAGRLIECGVAPETLDRAMTDFGMPVGPARLLDDIGLDVGLHVAETMQANFGERMRVPELMKSLVADGHLGRKSGSGIYLYHNGRSQTVNPVVKRQGGMSMADGEIADRLSLLMVAEGYRCLEEGIVDSADDIDFAMILGTGWAPFRGGPMAYGQSLGREKVKQALQQYSQADGVRYEIPDSL